VAPAPKDLPVRTQNYNVVVFYVDTLRYDVSQDPHIMPNVARFAGESLNFRKAYATGSDTLRSLPGLTGGNYFVRHTHEDDLCEVAKRSEHRSALFIAKSAHEFLKRLRPSFGFDEVFEIPDYPEGKEVWGYGADQSSARGIVDQALDYLAKHKSTKSFLWLFHFDQHNWRELDDKYLDTVRTKYKVPEEGVLNGRYRAVATAIDAEFARFRDGVEQLGLSDKTILLFVSDHGEGLGDGGFWVHSVFLWETLVHVPLMLKVPGVAPRAVDRVVSLVDVTPTLTRFLEPRPTLSGYHGQDLIERAKPSTGERRFPVLFAAALRDQLVRVGMVTEAGDSKLVVRLEAALPELHDLTATRPDDKNLAPERPELTRAMLEELARSPVFPRERRDFPMLEPKGPMKFSAPESSLTLRTE
jgi:arylsulfatase A-like enzyme